MHASGTPYHETLCFVKQQPQYFERQSYVIRKDIIPINVQKIFQPRSNLEIHQRNSYITAIQVYNKLPNVFQDKPLIFFKVNYPISVAIK